MLKSIKHSISFYYTTTIVTKRTKLFEIVIVLNPTLESLYECQLVQMFVSLS